MNRYVARILNQDGSEFAEYPVFAESPELAIEQARKAFPILFDGREPVGFHIEVDDGDRVSRR